MEFSSGTQNLTIDATYHSQLQPTDQSAQPLPTICNGPTSALGAAVETWSKQVQFTPDSRLLSAWLMLLHIRAELLWLRPDRPILAQAALCLDARGRAAAMLLHVGEEPRCMDDPHVSALFGDGTAYPRGMVDPSVNRLIANVAHGGRLGHGQEQALAKIAHCVASPAEPTQAVRKARSCVSAWNKGSSLFGRI